MKRKNFIYIILIVIWLFVIFSFSSDDSKESLKKSNQVIIKTAEIITQKELTQKEQDQLINKYIVIVRKSAHFFLYFTLGILVFLLAKKICGLKPVTIIYTIIFCILYASTDEIHQLFTNGRTARLFDVFIDTCGALLSISICYTFCIIRQKRMIKAK